MNHLFCTTFNIIQLSNLTTLTNTTHSPFQQARIQHAYSQKSSVQFPKRFVPFSKRSVSCKPFSFPNEYRTRPECVSGRVATISATMAIGASYKTIDNNNTSKKIRGELGMGPQGWGVLMKRKGVYRVFKQLDLSKHIPG